MNLDFSVNLRSKTPLSEQLQARIRQMIEENLLQPGDQLPTVRSLASQLQVHFNTVARAYRSLDEQGLIYTHQGRGAYVTERSAAKSTEQIESEDSLAHLIVVLENEARNRNLSPTQLMRLIQQRLERQDAARTRVIRRSWVYSKRRVHAARDLPDARPQSGQRQSNRLRRVRNARVNKK